MMQTMKNFLFLCWRALTKLWKRCELKKNQLSMMNSALSRHFVESESATDFKGFEALHKIFLDIDDRLFCFDVQTEVGRMYDEQRRSAETFQQNVTNWHCMSSIKNACICNKWLYMTCSNNKIWTLVFVKRIAHLIGMRTQTGVYLSGRLL